MTVTLDAWLYGTRVGTVGSSRPGRAELTFTDDALDRWGLGSSVLSGLLPLSTADPSPARVVAWLAGLMPEGRARLRLAEAAGVDPDDPVAFLAVYGKDTAGALVLVPEGDDPEPRGRLRPVTDQEIAQMLREAGDSGAVDQLTSVAGLETKIVLTATDAGWASPVGRPPSTHIVKLARPADSLAADLIDTEVAALELARSCGLTSVTGTITDFDGVRAIVVDRYDRCVRSDGTVARVHQEDAAQLLGLSTTDPDRKFQRGRALPSLRAIARAMVAMGDVRPRDLLALTAFNVAIGNIDAHAKNISFLHDDEGRTRLAPAYDVAMHRHHRHAGSLLAMDVNGTSGIEDVTGADLAAEGRGWGLTEREAVRAVRGTLSDLADALGSIDRGAHPGVPEVAWTTVERRTKSLIATTSALRPSGRSRRATGR